MLHALLYILFTLPFTLWLSHELNKKVSLSLHARWLAAAVVTGLIASILSSIFGGRSGNLLLHSIGGGVASVLLFIYILKTLRLSFNWRLEALLLFGFVSSLGVLNEIGEFAYELLHLGIMSPDTHDTWRDLVANTTGAALAWIIIQLLLRVKQSGSKQL